MAKNKKIIVAIGLETYDENIRNKVHTKGITNLSFEEAMKVLKNNEIESLVYIFVKPPIENYTDKNAYLEALESIKYAVDKGATVIELESGYIVENSKMHELYKKGLYEPLNLWTINKILIEANFKFPNTPVRLAYFTDTPKPLDGPKSCSNCNDDLILRFQNYREHMDIKALPTENFCNCSRI